MGPTPVWPSGGYRDGVEPTVTRFLRKMLEEKGEERNLPPCFQPGKSHLSFFRSRVLTARRAAGAAATEHGHPRRWTGLRSRGCQHRLWKSEARGPARPRAWRNYPPSKNIQGQETHAAEPRIRGGISGMRGVGSRSTWEQRPPGRLSGSHGPEAATFRGRVPSAMPPGQ